VATDSLQRLLRPRHIAVFGGAAAARVIQQCRRAGFAGEIWPVHPTRETVLDLPAFRNVAALPDAPDAAFIGVNRHATIHIVGELAARGAGGAVCHASGFAETDADGVALQAALLRAVGNMPILGPNCYGFINYLDGALLWPDQHGGHPVERGVAIVSQSGNIALNLSMQRRALPIAYLLSVGNQAALGMADLLAALAEDARVSAIGLHLEGLTDVARFTAAVQQARSLGKPVIVLTGGRSEQGRALALTHTASLSGGREALAALLERLGVARVESLPVFLETLKLLHVAGPLPGRRVMLLSSSGGEAGLAADAAEDAGLLCPALGEADRARIRPTLHPLVTLSNPFDYHTFDWGDGIRLAATFGAVLTGDFDLALLVSDLPRADRCDTADWDITLDAWCVAAAGVSRPTAVVSTLPELLPEARAGALMAAAIAPLLGLQEALRAVAASALVGEPREPFVPWSLASVDTVASATASEWLAKRQLTEHGIPVPRGALCQTEAELEQALVDLAYPLVAKASGAELTHKSERGAVRLHLMDAPATREAYGELRAMGEAVLVEEMVTDAVAELLLGLHRDPVVGFCLVIGLGGVLTELLRDTVTLPLPVAADEVRRALERLYGAALLAGFRGRPVADVAAVVDTVLRLQDLAWASRERLLALDINPLMVRPAGRGAVAVDALLHFAVAPP